MNLSGTGKLAALVAALGAAGGIGAALGTAPWKKGEPVSTSPPGPFVPQHRKPVVQHPDHPPPKGPVLRGRNLSVTSVDGGGVPEGWRLYVCGFDARGEEVNFPFDALR